MTDWLDALRASMPLPGAETAPLLRSLDIGLQAVAEVALRAPSRGPFFGECRALNLAESRHQRVGESPQSVESVIQLLAEYLDGCPLWGHTQALINVIPTPTTAALVGSLLAMLCNANLASEESSGRLAAAEIEVAAMLAQLIGFEPQQAGGVFTFGGTGTLLYAVKLGIEKCLPGSSASGLRELPVIVCSEHAHHACLTVASWAGLGSNNVIQIPSSPEFSIRPCLLESISRDLLRDGRKIACIVATLGTTEAFGLDDLVAVHDVRERLADEFRLDTLPHLHADAVIGWAWSVFNDYDFEVNSLRIPPQTIKSVLATRARIGDLKLADSVGIDFHKTGFAPYSSSLFLVRESEQLELLARERSVMPYLFQSGNYHPGRFTLETSRGGAGPLAALANLRLFGKDGLRSLLAHAVTITHSIRQELEASLRVRILNQSNHGPVTLFRVYPDAATLSRLRRCEFTASESRADFAAINVFNRRLYEKLQMAAKSGSGVAVSLTDCVAETDFGEPIVALKAYALSPHLTPDIGQRLVASLAVSSECE